MEVESNIKIFFAKKYQKQTVLKWLSKSARNRPFMSCTKILKEKMKESYPSNFISCDRDTKYVSKCDKDTTINQIIKHSCEHIYENSK